MGAETSKRSQEEKLSAEVTATEGGSSVADPAKPLQKNGQISSMSSLNDHSEDNTLTEVAQTESVSAAPKEGAAETMGTIQDEVAPQVNGEKEQKECPNGSEITAVEEKAAEQKPSETNEVGFKKIFRFAGFKFTLKKDKSEEKNPVKLLTVKDKEEEAVSKAETAEEATTAGEEVTAKETEVETEVKVTEATEEAATAEVPAEEATATDAEAKDKVDQEAESSPPPPVAESSPPPPEAESSPPPPEAESNPPPPEAESSPAAPEAESSPAPPEAESSPAPPEAESSPAPAEVESSPAPAEEESSPAAEEGESSPAAEEGESSTAAPDAESSPPSEEAKISPPVHEIILSPFRKLFTGGLFSNLRKKNSIKSKEEEEKEKEAEGETAEAGETAQAETVEAQQEEAKEEPPTTTPEEVKPESTPEAEVAEVTPPPAADNTDEPKPAEEAETAPEEEIASAEVATEAEILSSQEKTKAQGSPLKKLFTGAGLKKLSTKKSKSKKDAESKLTESGEQTADQLQASTESAECQKPDSGASSPEESGEHVIAEDALPVEQNQEVEGEVAQKKEGIIPWSSFKKLVTPKRRVKKSSDSEDEATTEKVEKPVKSATLSSTESAVFADKCNEEEAKEEKEDKPTEEEPKTENTEKLEGSTEESRKKMDTSVSWEALMCMGGAKKRTRKTSDSDDDETKIEEETPAAEGGEEPESKPTETAEVTTQETDTEGAEGEVVAEPEPVSTPPERETAWTILKRFVMPKIKAKTDEKTEETPEQAVSETEVPKEESSFSFRKFLHGRRKKKVEKQSSTEVEEDSDTPAVVPLSEYDAEPAKNEEEPPVEAEITQTKVSAEDRSPSWIPATVEDDDKQLSDIPEEAENAATPKSADTTIAEDVIEEQAKLSTAEVKSQPEVAVTTPIPEGPMSETATVVIEGIADQVSVIPCQTSVTVEDAPIGLAAAETEHELPIEHAVSLKTKSTLESHSKEEAVAICTGLGTKEIAKVALEKPVDATLECAVETTDAVCTLLSVQEKPLQSEEAIAAAEVPMFVAQVHQVESSEFNPAVEKPEIEIPEIQTATEMEEPNIEIVTVVSSLPQQSETVLPSEPSENSPKVAIVDAIIPTIEAIICTESVEVTEPGVETKEIEVGLEQVAATEEHAPLEEMAQAVSEEIISAISDTLKNTTTEVSEPAIAVVVPAEEVAVIQETVVQVAPLSANVEQLETTVETAMEKIPISEPVGDEPIQVQETMAVCATVVESAVTDIIVAATSEVSTSVIEHSVVDAEPEVEQANAAIEEQSMVIAQAVIMNALDEVKEAEPEAKPTTPTADIQSPEPEPATPTADVQSPEAEPTTLTADVQSPEAEPTAPTADVQSPEAEPTPDVQSPEAEPTPDVQSPEAEPTTLTADVQSPTTPTADVPSPVQAVSTTEEHVELETEKPVITDTPVPVIHETPAPVETPPRPLNVAVQVIDSVAVEVTESIVAPTDEIKPAEGLKEAVEVEESEAIVLAEEVVELNTESQPSGNLEEEQSKVVPEDVKEASEEVIPEPEVTKTETPTEEKKEEIPEIHMPSQAVLPQVVLQAAHMVETPMVEEDAVVEFDSNGPVNDTAPAKEADVNADSSCDQKPVSDQIPTLLEESQTNASTELATSSQEAPVEATATSPVETETVSSSGKCAEVMAQVIEVIEEAVKEIEPISTELTAAS